MAKTRGKLNKQDMNQLDHAQIVETKHINHGITTPAKVKREDKPRRKLAANTIIIIVALFILSGGVVYGLISGSFQLGTVAVDELTAVHVIMNINSTPQEVMTNASTIEELLNEQRIRLDENDYIGQDLDQELFDGMTVWLRLSVPISIVVNGQTYSLESQPITVQEALDAVGVKLSPDDKTSLPLLQYIYNESTIDVIKVRTETVNVEEPIEPTEVQQECVYLTPGSSTIISQGRNGVRQCTYEIRYENDVEVYRNELDSRVILEPEDRIIGVGPSTSSVMGEVDADGNPVLHIAKTEDGASFYYKQQFETEATAYTWTGSTTATGSVPKRGTIAVDPDVIPLGSKVYIVGYGFATAEDTGGAIKGNIVDLYMDTEQECLNWGRRDVIIYILAN